MSNTIVTLEKIGKCYRRDQFQFLYRDILKWILRRKRTQNDFWALKNVTLTVRRGESVGIIGENGSGKSTLLKILSNVTDPTCGTMKIDGRISSLLELGAGFHPQLTGRENIYLNGVILGMSKRNIDLLFDQIVDFSGIREFIDQPVMTYSSGMYVRLGFSIAVHTDPDILIIDEVLAVGDEEFQRKCKHSLRELNGRGKTILFVSHDLSTIRELCQRVYWLKKGEIQMEGERDEVTFAYLTHVGARDGLFTLSRGPLTLIFERGKLILFWNGIELTKNCCIFTEVYASNCVQGSMSARWEILSYDRTHLVVRGQWKLFPVEQLWRIDLSSDNRIRWQVEMKVQDTFELRTDTINLMLTDRYSEWFTPSVLGEFPVDFHEAFGQRLIGIGDGSPEVGVRAKILKGLSLPEILTRITSHPENFFVQVTNTDLKLQSRTIQYSRIESKEYKDKCQNLDFEVEFILKEICQ